MNYSVEDKGDHRLLIIGEKSYKTKYSKRIIDLIIERKGLTRAPEYFVHKDKRNKFLTPLFNYLKEENLKGLRILEVGCSAGHFTELLNETPSIKEIYSFDIDKIFVDITKLKVAELKLEKVKSVDCFSVQKTASLPYEDNFFDIVLVFAVVEHLPYENRHFYVDEYYRTVKKGGMVCFLDTPNRHYFLESHSIGLPFVQFMKPHNAFFYSKLFGKLGKDVTFPEFVRAGTGWRNASYYELLPRTLTISIDDISEKLGYGYKFFQTIPRSPKFKLLISPFIKLLRVISLKFNFPTVFFLPYLNVVFQKVHDFEKEV
jgi:S-adenosylmethionine-dependent methyltransferase